MSPRQPPARTKPAPVSVSRYAQQVEAQALTILEDSHMTLPPGVIATFIERQVCDALSYQGATAKDVLASLPQADDYAFEVASNLLAEVAEERPGTNPFAHQGVIPLPLSDLVTLLANLQWAAQIAFDANESRDEVRQLTLTAAQCSTWLANTLSRAEASPTPLNCLRPLNPLILTPLPAVALVLRVLRHAVTRIQQHAWQPTLIDDTDNLEGLAEEMSALIDRIEQEKTRFGGHASPSIWS